MSERTELGSHQGSPSASSPLQGGVGGNKVARMLGLDEETGEMEAALLEAHRMASREKAIMQGFLKKKGRNALKNDRYRYFVLKEGGWLEYYKSPHDFKRKVKPVGVVDLCGATITALGTDKTFQLKAQLKPYYLVSATPADAQLWCRKLNDGIEWANRGRESSAIQALRELERTEKSLGQDSGHGASLSEDGNVFWSSNVFELSQKLGTGAYGTVYRAKMVDSAFDCAIKVMDPGTNKSTIITEYEALKKCQHPNIVQYYGCCFKHSRELWILMEYVDAGSFADVLESAQQLLNEQQLSFVLREVLRGLRYLHEEHNMVHRDVKAANVLLNRLGEVKIADFGVAHQFSEELNTTVTQLGTPHWMAPEVWKEEEYTVAADIWSLGCTGFEMAMGRPPFSDLTIFGVYNRVVSGPRPELPDKFSESLKVFLCRCFTKDHEVRPNAGELLEDPFIAENRATDAKILQPILARWARNKKTKEFKSSFRFFKRVHGRALSAKNADDEARRLIRERRSKADGEDEVGQTISDTMIVNTMVVHDTDTESTDSRPGTPGARPLTPGLSEILRSGGMDFPRTPSPGRSPARTPDPPK